MHPDDLPTITKRQADKMVANAVAKALAELKPVIPPDAITGGIYTSPVLHEPDAVARSLDAARPVKVEEYPLIGLGDDYIDAPKSFTVGKGFQYTASPVEPVVDVQKPVMPPAIMDEAWTDGEDDAE